MIVRNLRTYMKFLSRNKAYSFISIFGFSVSLMFVILLSLYAKQEWTVDSFHEKKDRIFLMTHDGIPSFGSTVAPFVKDNYPEVESFCRMSIKVADIGAQGKDKYKAKALLADSTFFSIFSYNLIEGNPSEVLVPKNSVVLTESFAKREFKSENPIGKTLTVENNEYIVTGIMENFPSNSHIPECDFILTYYALTHFHGGEWVVNSSSNFGFSAYILEKEGADIVSRTPELLEQFKKEFWYYKDGFTDNLELIPIEEAYFSVKEVWDYEIKSNDKRLVKIYFGIALLIFVIATLNYINMTVAQASFRGKEAAIKKLVGSDSKSIILQLLGESLLMAVITFGLGFFLALLVEPFFNNLMNTKLDIVGLLTPTIIAISVLFTLLIAFASGIIPALVISRFEPIEIVKGNFSRKVKTSYAKGLIIFQNVASIALIICSMCIKKQADYMINYDMGYDTNNILVMDNAMDSTQQIAFGNILRGMPDVQMFSFSRGTLFDRGNNMSFEYQGQQYSFQELVVDSVFFDLFGVTTESTGVAKSEKALWVNKFVFDDQVTNKEDLTLYIDSKNKVPIMGVLNDLKMGSLYQESPHIRIGSLTRGSWAWNISVKIKDGVNLFHARDKIEVEYKKYTDGGVPNTYFIHQKLEDTYNQETKLSYILSAFTLLTIIISVMGVLGMSLYLVKQKEKEIGVRKVNGATVLQILWMLNKESQLRVLIGFVIACPIAYYTMNRWLADFNYQTSLDWWLFVASGAIISFLTFLSVSYITWRAANANPIEILKNE